MTAAYLHPTELSPVTAEPASFTVQDAWESVAIACALGQDIPAIPGTCVYQLAGVKTRP